MKNLFIIKIMTIALIYSCCNQNQKTANNNDSPQTDTFNYFVERFADVRILRYQVPGFNNLTLPQKELIYYLSEAALCGRDIIFDQNYKHNLRIRKTLDVIVQTYKGEKESQDFLKFMEYTKRVWFSNGIHHHYSEDKFIPEFSKQYFAMLINNSDPAKLPLKENETPQELINELSTIIFDPTIAPKKRCQEQGKDVVVESAVNFYEGVTRKEVEKFYEAMQKPNDPEPISYGLNSKVVKENGKIVEKVAKIGGLYSPAIEKIVYWLNKAMGVAENDQQKAVIAELIKYYKTGDLKTFDNYNILWVQDLKSQVDFVNGFIEVYSDPLARKGTWEAVVNFKDLAASERTEKISANAQWFEDNSPVDARFKRNAVTGVSAKVITVAQLGGDCFPSTPIGINLPNANWIRATHGSKSVTMENITYAYYMAGLQDGQLEEFCYSQEEIDNAKKYGNIADNLHTDLHECLGHGSGKLLPGVSSDALGEYHSVIEEARADLFALYYAMDNKMLELGLLPSLDAAKDLYTGYIRNGLFTQYKRIELGKNIEQAHMRNRALIARWCYEKGMGENIIEKKIKNGKTYFVVNDFDKLRKLFGTLLNEIQRIKSEGDYNAAKTLVETYAIKIDYNLHKEVLERFNKLNLASYTGFINPIFKPVYEGNKIIDITIEYINDYTQEMLYYSNNYSFL